MNKRSLNKRIAELEAELAWYVDTYGKRPPEQVRSKRKYTVTAAVTNAAAKARAARKPQPRDPTTRRFVASGMVAAERPKAGDPS